MYESLRSTALIETKKMTSRAAHPGHICGVSCPQQPFLEVPATCFRGRPHLVVFGGWPVGWDFFLELPSISCGVTDTEMSKRSAGEGNQQSVSSSTCSFTHEWKSKAAFEYKPDTLWASLVALEVKESACNAGNLGSIPRLGRSSGGGHGNPLQYSCLEKPKDRGARTTVHGVTKSRTRLID